MPRYKVTRPFGSHLGNHEVGEPLTLPEGPLPRGFEGFVEPWPEPKAAPATLPDYVTPELVAAAQAGFASVYDTKDVTPASRRANDAPADAGPITREAGQVPPAADSEASSPSASDAPPEPEEPPSPAPRAEAGYYTDKALRSGKNRGRR